ncbi:MAG: hypothetical protein KZQ88_12405 [Candidatus Thiodiazotropha sp. (ex Dulcina madagascariensis)]|nr:hypothetical protein [Candidatus Thiodiazotropha sp. (ex Dulcina madagascariensis)]MCU7926599.1 hypothetical protein [Candidatus Thiodiazotropha sp. (ex Dulcina madagascariensis)]
MPEALRRAALDYHRSPRPGKLEIKATKPMANQCDLALAYSPGVAAACQEIGGLAANLLIMPNQDAANVAFNRLIYIA